jgi:hypothetical protein
LHALVRTTWHLAFVAGTVALAVTGASAYEDVRSISSLEIPLASDPGTRFHHGRGARASVLLRDEASAVAAAREVLRRHENALSLGRARLGASDVRRARDKWSVHFRLEIDGVPVWGASAFVLLNDAGVVAAFGAPAVPSTVVARGAAISTQDAVRIAGSSLGAPDASSSFEPETVWVIVDETARLAHRVGVRTSEPFGSWTTFVDASSGAILARTSRIHPLDVSATVTAAVEDHGYCDGEQDRPLPLTTVSILGGASGTTDVSGEVTIPYSGPSTFAAVTRLAGPFLTTARAAGLGSVFAVLPGVEGQPLTHQWDDTNSRPDERDLFLTVNRAHEFMKALDPSFVAIDFAMPCISKRDRSCRSSGWSS